MGYIVDFHFYTPGKPPMHANLRTMLSKHNELVVISIVIPTNRVPGGISAQGFLIVD